MFNNLSVKYCSVFSARLLSLSVDIEYNQCLINTNVVVNLVAGDVWEYEDELTGTLSERVKIWD